MRLLVQEASEMSTEGEAESGEMESAQESLAEAEKSGGLGSRAGFQNLIQVPFHTFSFSLTSLIFCT